MYKVKKKKLIKLYLCVKTSLRNSHIQIGDEKVPPKNTQLLINLYYIKPLLGGLHNIERISYI